ncbi:hypothetical protein B0H19DRAFT_1152369, partial [Mycena capillaripes]
MPRKKRATPIQNHYSKDLKQRVIYQAFTLRKGSKEIAHDLNMPLPVVQRGNLPMPTERQRGISMM